MGNASNCMGAKNWMVWTGNLNGEPPHSHSPFRLFSFSPVQVVFTCTSRKAICVWVASLSSESNRISLRAVVPGRECTAHLDCSIRLLTLFLASLWVFLIAASTFLWHEPSGGWSLSLSCCLCSQLFSRCLTSWRGWNVINIVCINYLLNPALVINNFTLPCSNLISHKAFTSWFTQGGGVGHFSCLTEPEIFTGNCIL